MYMEVKIHMNELINQFFPYQSASWLKEILSNPVLLTLSVVSLFYLYYHFKRKFDQGDLSLSMPVANIIAILGVIAVIYIGL